MRRRVGVQMGNRIVWGDEIGAMPASSPFTSANPTTDDASAKAPSTKTSPLSALPRLFTKPLPTGTSKPATKIDPTQLPGYQKSQPGAPSSSGSGMGIRPSSLTQLPSLPGFQQPMIRQPAVMNIIPTPATTTQPYYDGGGGGGGGGGSSSPEPTPTPPTPEPTPEYTPVETIPSDLQVQTEEKPKKDNTLLYVIGGIAAAIGIGGIVAAVYLGKRKE